MTSYQTYPKYKPSNVNWLGDIPSHWGVKKLKFVATVQPSNVDKKSIEGEEPVLLCNYTDVYKNEFIDARLEFMQATATEDEIKKFSVDVGDVIVTKDSETPDDIAVPACIVEKVEGLLCGYHLTQIKPIDLNGRYLFRLFQSKGFNAQFTVAANGVTRYGLPQYAIANAFSPVPPIGEQNAIVRFLDYKTAQIDALIAKKQALLTKLAEKRTALISHAVTKGLDPSVPMKDSGVQWLGEIPAHWLFLPFRRLMVGGTQNGLYKSKDFFNINGTPFIQMGEAFSEPIIKKTAKDRVLLSDAELSQWRLEEGDLIFARRSLVFEGSGKCSIVGSLKESHVYESSMIRVRLDNKRIIPMFGFYFFCSALGRAQILSITKQVTISGIDSQQLKDIFVCLPPINFQKQIVEYISEEEKRYLKSCLIINTIISNLIEYCCSLITNAVTGKIDVRDFIVPAQAETRNKASPGEALDSRFRENDGVVKETADA